MDLFSARLKELRQDKAISQKFLGNAIGISDRAYSDIEKGKAKPAFETLLNLCEYFNVSSDYLLGLSNTKERDKDFIMNKFSERLIEIRSKKGITQKAVAEYLEMHPKAYQLYEYGKREPEFNTLMTICEYFDVSADYLLGLSEIKERR